ncbi:hypothetical protein BJY01DRAFT_253484 [Aspergillus pseudoustus]|uniref:Uncharacterized protein n=1 Tax=Aspergillus pseudoustus TaxID=1810923 RepID=A0ABR4J0K1_9EURO
MSRPGSPSSTYQEWLWDSSYLGRQFPPEDSDFSVTAIECWNYKEKSSNRSLPSKHKKETFPISSVDAWLKTPYPSEPNHQLSSGFKILVIPLDSDDNCVLPAISEPGMTSIHAALGLPPVYRHSASTDTGADGMFLQPDGSYGNLSYRSTGVTLRYDPLTNVTQGIFLLIDKSVPLACFNKLQSKFSTCPHPLLLLLIVLETSVELNVTIEAAEAEAALRKIEQETGYDLSFPPGGMSHVPVQTDNLRALIQRLGASRSRLVLYLSDMRADRRSTEFLQRKISYLSKSLPEDVKQKLQQPSRMLEERVEFLASNIENALDYSAINERMETQQSVVFNLIAQMDGMVNIGLAKDSKEIAAASKRDSSAMKIVAVLTTFFLPGTFMATFFAMPLFDWSETSMNNVANKHFWIYWAVTGPLTVVIVIGVACWAFLQSRHAERLAQKARRTVGIGLASDDEGEGTPTTTTKKV